MSRIIGLPVGLKSHDFRQQGLKNASWALLTCIHFKSIPPGSPQGGSPNRKLMFRAQIQRLRITQHFSVFSCWAFNTILLVKLVESSHQLRVQSPQAWSKMDSQKFCMPCQHIIQVAIDSTLETGSENIYFDGMQGVGRSYRRHDHLFMAGFSASGKGDGPFF